MTRENRRDRARRRCDELGVDALLVTKPVNVRYLSGFTGSNGQLLIGAEDVFLTDPRYDEQSAKECAGVRRALYGTSAKQIGEAAGLLGVLDSVTSELKVSKLGVEAGHMTLNFARQIREALGDVTLVETDETIENLRIVKDEEEVEAIRRACAFADEALDALLDELREGMTEIDVAAFLEDRMRRAGSQGVSFDTIAAFGEQAAEPHHHPTIRALRRGDLIKLDYGATYDGYHSDMTRTIAFGEPPSDLVEIYELVRSAQQAGVDAVRAGATNGDVDAAARGYLNERGRDFGHGTGHGVGLEVHEAPAIRRGGQQALEPGMVITVEPGIYVPGVGGVRIEDSVVVRPDGCDILTSSTKELVKV